MRGGVVVAVHLNCAALAKTFGSVQAIHTSQPDALRFLPIECARLHSASHQNPKMRFVSVPTTPALSFFPCACPSSLEKIFGSILPSSLKRLVAVADSFPAAPPAPGGAPGPALGFFASQAEDAGRTVAGVPNVDVEAEVVVDGDGEASPAGEAPAAGKALPVPDDADADAEAEGAALPSAHLTPIMQFPPSTSPFRRRARSALHSLSYPIVSQFAPLGRSLSLLPEVAVEVEAEAEESESEL